MGFILFCTCLIFEIVSHLEPQGESKYKYFKYINSPFTAVLRFGGVHFLKKYWHIHNVCHLMDYYLNPWSPCLPLFLPPPSLQFITSPFITCLLLS